MIDYDNYGAKYLLQIFIAAYVCNQDNNIRIY